jgi:hypothetical protein
MAMGWKPQLAGSKTQVEPAVSFASLKAAQLVRSSSAQLLSRFSPDNSPDDDDKTPQGELERNIDSRIVVTKNLPFRKSRSADALVRPVIGGTVVSTVPEDLKTEKTRVLHSERKRRMTMDEVKNKPLPTIGMV